MRNLDKDYLFARAKEELRQAENASHPAAREAHLQLARQYEIRSKGIAVVRTAKSHLGGNPHCEAFEPQAQRLSVNGSSAIGDDDKARH